MHFITVQLPNPQAPLEMVVLPETTVSDLLTMLLDTAAQPLVAAGATLHNDGDEVDADTYAHEFDALSLETPGSETAPAPAVVAEAQRFIDQITTPAPAPVPAPTPAPAQTAENWVFVSNQYRPNLQALFQAEQEGVPFVVQGHSGNIYPQSVYERLHGTQALLRNARLRDTNMEGIFFLHGVGEENRDDERARRQAQHDTRSRHLHSVQHLLSQILSDRPVFSRRKVDFAESGDLPSYAQATFRDVFVVAISDQGPNTPMTVLQQTVECLVLNLDMSTPLAAVPGVLNAALDTYIQAFPNVVEDRRRDRFVQALATSMSPFGQPNLEESYTTELAETTELFTSHTRSAEQILARLAGPAPDEAEWIRQADQTITSLIRIAKIVSAKVLPRSNAVQLRTRRLTCTNPKTGTVHAMGAYDITLNFDTNRISWHNLTRRVNETHHPHIQNGPCLGNLESMIHASFRDRNIPALAAMAIRFVESVNPDDAWGSSIRSWPVHGSEEDLEAHGTNLVHGEDEEDDEERPEEEEEEEDGE